VMVNDPKAAGTSGWTVETLYVHFSQRFADQEKAVQAALAAAEKAVNKAETNAEKWRDNANEWRGAMTDREKNFAPLQRLEVIEKRLDTREGAGQGLKAGWGYLVAAVGALIGLGALILRAIGK